jgi:hypothetical protein
MMLEIFFNCVVAFHIVDDRVAIKEKHYKPFLNLRELLRPDFRIEDGYRRGILDPIFGVANIPKCKPIDTDVFEFSDFGKMISKSSVCVVFDSGTKILTHFGYHFAEAFPVCVGASKELIRFSSPLDRFLSNLYAI